MMDNKQKEPWADPDDAPPANREWFEKADHYRDGKLIQPSRRKGRQGRGW